MEFDKPLNGPIKSNDSNYMYHYCTQKIAKAKTHEQLLQYLKILIPMDNLKNKLIEIIDELQLQTKNNNNSKTLKKLYLNSSSIAEIFPDHILVNVIKYLPSEQFSCIPVLSTNFHAIMTKYPILYKNYKVVIDEIPMHYDTQFIKLLINHSKKSIYIKLAEMEYDGVANLDNMGNMDDSLMFTASFDSKWGGLIPNFSMQHSLGPKGSNYKIRILNPFSAQFPWFQVPKYILYGDKWSQTRNIMNLSPTISNNNNNNINNNNNYNHTTYDIWMKAAPNIISLELENCSKHFITELPATFNKLNHLKFTGTLHDSPRKYINIDSVSRFPHLLYLEFHKIEIDAQSISMSQFLKKEKLRFENVNEIYNININDDELNEFIGIRARISYRYKIMNEILSYFKNLLVFKYYDDGVTINSIEMDLSQKHNNNNNNNDHIYNVAFIKRLRENNGCIAFPESLQFISLINCDCLLDFSACQNIIGLNLYGINYKQIIKWPICNIIQCLICSTQTEITQDWNNIFESTKYQYNNKKLKGNNNNIHMYAHMLPVRFMKRITNRTLEEPIEGILQRSISTQSTKSIKSMQSSDSTVKPIKSKIDQIYVANKLNKSMKSFDLYNNNNMNMDMNLNLNNMNSLNDLIALPLDKVQKSLIFDVFEEYKKMEFIVSKDNELMCMEIEDENEIFYRLLATIYGQKPDLLQNKIELYESWWKLKIAIWIKHIGKQIIPKSQRNIF